MGYFQQHIRTVLLNFVTMPVTAPEKSELSNTGLLPVETNLLFLNK